MASQARTAPIAGFWIRLLAQIIDACVWAFIASLIGWALVYLAPNTFGLASAFPESKSCQRLSSPPPAITVPAGLSPNVIAHCSKSFFGLEFRNEVILAEQHREGNVTTTKSVIYVVGRDIWFGFLAYIVVAQGVDGAMFGKRLLGLRVIGPDGGPPGWRAAAVRNLVLYGPLFVAVAILLLIAASGSFFARFSLVMWVTGAMGFASLAIVVQIWFTASNGTPSIHDRIAGTRVVKLQRNNRESAPGSHG